MFIHYSLILVIVLSGCALKIAPSGGPANTAPTRVLEVFPASGSVNQEQPEIRFVFDDYVDRSIRNSITVMPKTPFVTTYDGDAISISFSQQLLPSTTYSVTLGTSWRNLRGIEPTQATTIIFSTGPVIDTGTISGRVVAENLSNLVVAAFPRADTLDSAFNSMKAIAPYQIQIGSDGTFSI
ncbi:MAG: Ig-like domain-containing protein, partial [Flavobacteriales bacterium]|nr:Ig-like domain-containing protein [Flavobacteriales bacterium]